MNEIDKFKVYDSVLRLGSMNHQDKKLIEELSELITELVRVQTGRNKPNAKEVVGELADCIIMIEQYLRNHNLFSLVELAKDCKLKRLKYRISSGGVLEKQ